MAPSRIRLDSEWARLDREAWAAYQLWEDKHFFLSLRNPLKDPPGMAESRRAFERFQRVEREKFFKKAAYDGRR